MDHGSVSADLTVRVGQLVGPYLIPGAVDRVANLPPARCAHRVGKFDARARSGRESADHRPRRLTRGTGGEVPLGRPAAAHGLSRRTNTASSRFMRRRYPRGRPAADLRALRESPQSEHRDGLAAFRQSGIPGHTIESAMTACVNAANDLACENRSLLEPAADPLLKGGPGTSSGSILA